jgi:hypothetical protein
MTPDLKMQLYVDKVPQLVGPDDLAASGFMYSAMSTEERDAIAQPAAGMVRYNSTTNKLNFYNGIAWEEVTSTVVVIARSSGSGSGTISKAPEHKVPDRDQQQPKAEQMPAPTPPHTSAPTPKAPEPHHK